MNIIFTLLQIPYTLIFIGPNCDLTWSDYLNLVSDIFFMVDILVNFNTGYLDESAVLVKDHATIARRYLRWGIRSAANMDLH